MKKLILLFFVLVILASSVFAADVSITYIDSSCDGEGRGIFYFIIDFEAPFYSNEALIKGFPGNWYDCADAHCSYNYYQKPPGVPPKNTISTGKEYMLITEPLSLKDKRTYDLQFIYPIVVSDKEGEDYNTIDISLDCPGYDFSCSLYDYELVSCESDGENFRAYINAEGIDQPRKVDLIEDFRYRLIGENTQLVEDRPLNDASIKYTGRTVLVEPTKAEVRSIAKDRYVIEFPYEDTAKWFTAKGKYCKTDKDRFGISSNYEFIEMKKCDVNGKAPVPVDRNSVNYYPVPAKTTTTRTATKTVEEEPEDTGPKQEIGFFSFFKLLFEGLFGKK